MNQSLIMMIDILPNDGHTISYQQINFGNNKKESKKASTKVAHDTLSLPSSPFPIVAEAIQEDLERYRQSEDEVKRMKTAMVRWFSCHDIFDEEFHSGY